MTVEALTLLYREAVNALSDRMCIDGSDEFCDKALKPGDIFHECAKCWHGYLVELVIENKPELEKELKGIEFDKL